MVKLGPSPIEEVYGFAVLGFIGHRGCGGLVARLEWLCVSHVNDHVVDDVHAVSNRGGVDDFTVFVAQRGQHVAWGGSAHFVAALCGVCGLGDGGQLAGRVCFAVGRGFVVAAVVGRGDDLVCGPRMAQACAFAGEHDACVANEQLGLFGRGGGQCHQCDGADFDDCFVGDEQRPPRNHTSGQPVFYLVQVVPICRHVCGRAMAVYLARHRYFVGGVCGGVVVLVCRL